MDASDSTLSAGVRTHSVPAGSTTVLHAGSSSDGLGLNMTVLVTLVVVALVVGILIGWTVKPATKKVLSEEDKKKQHEQAMQNRMNQLAQFKARATRYLPTIASTHVRELTTVAEAEVLLASKSPTILLAYGTFCGNCTGMMGAFNEAALKATETGVLFARIEIHLAEVQALANHKIGGVPFMLTVRPDGSIDAGGVPGPRRSAAGLLDYARSLSLSAALVPAPVPAPAPPQQQQQQPAPTPLTDYQARISERLAALSPPITT